MKKFIIFFVLFITAWHAEAGGNTGSNHQAIAAPKKKITAAFTTCSRPLHSDIDITALPVVSAGLVMHKAHHGPTAGFTSQKNAVKPVTVFLAATCSNSSCHVSEKKYLFFIYPSHNFW